MRSIVKMLGLAFFATLAFSAVGVIGGAGSASALLFLTTNAKESFTVKSLNNAILESKGGNAVECKTTLGSGFILNKTDRAHTVLLTFHECKIKGLATACTTTGEPTGLIMTLQLDALLVTTLTGKYGLLISSEKGNLAEFSCGGISDTVKGTVVGEFTESKAESEVAKTEAKLEFAKEAGQTGVPKIKSYWTLQGTAEPKLESSLAGLGFEESSQEGVGDVVTPSAVSFCHK